MGFVGAAGVRRLGIIVHIMGEEDQPQGKSTKTVAGTQRTAHLLLQVFGAGQEKIATPWSLLRPSRVKFS